MKNLFLFLILFVLSNICYANNSDSLFISKFYEIQFISNNVDEDKKNKIEEIKKLSISKIFDQILIKKDVNKINRNISSDLINTFIKNIIVEDEKIINNNYYSKIKVNFDKMKIVEYLRSNKIPYVEFYPNNFLTIIYEDNEIDKNLFSKNNSHYNFLIKNNEDYLFYKIPNLDINDKFILTEEDIVKKNYIKINNFGSKYLTNNIIVILSKKKSNKLNYLVYIFSNNEFINEIKLQYYNNNFSKFFNDLESIVLDNWKIKNNIQNELLKIIDCEINYFNLLELRQIKLNVNNISAIKNINLKKISYKNNTYEIEYYGNEIILPKLFEINGLIMKNIDNNCKVFLK